jgi:hypothetical protein
MEKPWLIKEMRAECICYILLSFLFMITVSCQQKPKKMQSKGTVKGILQDSAGRPVADAIIMIVDGTAATNDIASVSNEKGEFFISNVVLPGRYVLQIQNNSQQKQHEVNLSANDSTIRVTF